MAVKKDIDYEGLRRAEFLADARAMAELAQRVLANDNSEDGTNLKEWLAWLPERLGAFFQCYTCAKVVAPISDKVVLSFKKDAFKVFYDVNNNINLLIEWLKDDKIPYYVNMSKSPFERKEPIETQLDLALLIHDGMKILREHLVTIITLAVLRKGLTDHATGEETRLIDCTYPTR